MTATFLRNTYPLTATNPHILPWPNTNRGLTTTRFHDALRSAATFLCLPPTHMPYRYISKLTSRGEEELPAIVIVANSVEFKRAQYCAHVHAHLLWNRCFRFPCLPVRRRRRCLPRRNSRGLRCTCLRVRRHQRRVQRRKSRGKSAHARPNPGTSLSFLAVIVRATG